MNKLKLISIIIAVVFLVAFATACDKGAPAEQTQADAASDSEEQAELPKIGVTVYRYDNNFMSFVRVAMEAAAVGKCELMMVDSMNDQAKQNDQVDTMISKGVDALAINLVDPAAAGTIIAKAKEADIPVVFYNKEPPAEDMASYDKTWYIGTESAEAGIMQGDMIAQSWVDNPEFDKNGDGIMQYVMLKGEPGHPEAEARTKYAVEEINNKGIETEELAIDAAMWDSAKAKDFMQTWLAKYGEQIEYVICNNDGMALGAVEALKSGGYLSDGKYTPVVGVDAIPEALTLIENGEMEGTILQDAKKLGRVTMELTLNVALGNDILKGTEWTLDDVKAVRIPYVPINDENMDVAKEAYAE